MTAAPASQAKPKSNHACATLPPFDRTGWKRVALRGWTPPGAAAPPASNSKQKTPAGRPAGVLSKRDQRNRTVALSGDCSPWARKVAAGS
jgi:hypothetical protein